MEITYLDPEVRPPYVRFEYHAVEDRAASIAQGHFVSKDVVYAYITRPGQRDTHTVVYDEYMVQLKASARQGRVPPSWIPHIEALYNEWKSGAEIEGDGTPINGWAVLSPSSQRTLRQAGIRTVEDLAALDDAACQAVGMGAVGFREKARAWLASANSVGKVTEELVDLRAKMEALMRTNAELMQKLAASQPTK